MKVYDFIFSESLRHRLLRHFTFWMAFIIYFYSVNFLPTKPQDLSDYRTYLEAFRLMIYIPVSVISVYTAIYFLLPRYILKEKYFKLFLMIVVLTMFYFSLAGMIMLFLAHITMPGVPFSKLPVTLKWFHPIRYGIGLPITSAVFTTIIKMMKNWQLEQKENELLQRKKIDTELQLLKTQFQPDFLHDALQHIFFLIRKHSPQSPETVLKLSDLLSYILYENEKDEVPLEKEIQIIRTYLSLKKTFYPERLRVQVKQQGDITGMNIAPLLLVSLVECCLENFMQGTRQQLDLSLTLKAESGELYFLAECKSSFENHLMENNAPGWAKPKKRIEMLYPGRHSFDLYSENDTASILLVLEPGKIPFIIKEHDEFVLT